MAVKKGNRWAPVIMIGLLLILLFVVRQCQNKAPETPETKTEEKQVVKGLNRNPATINYSKHARCRMDCRKIDESEVESILHTGKINYAKSEIGELPDCRKKYAVEGKTHDGQRVRIIFAPCKNEMTVVTVIDLAKDWVCECD